MATHQKALITGAAVGVLTWLVANQYNCRNILVPAVAGAAALGACYLIK